MPNRIVRYIITGDSAGAVRAMKETETAAKKAETGLAAAGSRMKSLGAGMVGLGRSLEAVSLPVALVGGYAVKSAMGFQTSMTLIQTQAGASANEVRKMSHAVLGLSGKVATSPEELAKALYPIESVGLRGSKALQALTAAAKGAQISGAGVTEVANAMAGALRTSLPDIHSAAGAMSIMNGIVGLGKLHLDELTGAMSTDILPQAKALGLGFRDVGAALDAMTRQSVPAATEATRLRLSLTQMTAPSGIALRALQAIGLGQFSLANDLRKPGHLITALQDLRTHLKGLSKDQQDLILSDAFGKARGSANIIGLLNALPEMEGIRGKLSKYGEPQLNQAFGVRSQNAAFKMQEALSKLKAALVELGNVLIPVVVPAMVKLAGLVQHGAEWFKKLPGPVRDATIYFGLFMITAGPMLIFFGNLAKAAGTLMEVLPKLTKILPGFGAAAGEAGEAASVGIAGLLPEIAALLAAAAAVVAIYKGVQAIKAFISPHTGRARTPAARALRAMHQPSEFTANTQGALAMLSGGSRVNYGALAPGSAAEVALLKARGSGGASELTGTAVPETAAGRARRKEIEEHNQQTIVLHNVIQLDGKVVAKNTVHHVRNNPQIARPVAEGVTKYAQHRKARE